MNSSHIQTRAKAQSLSEAEPTGRQFLLGILLSGGAGVVAALCSMLGTGQWYRALIKPVWAPAQWTFVPLQLIMFVLAGVGLAYMWASHSSEKSKRVVLAWFWVQLALSIVWSVCFFVLHSPAWAYTVIMMLWCAVVALLWTGSRLSRRGFWFLAPLFFWITFTSSLTFAILSFNVLQEESAQMDADPRNGNSPADPPIIVRKR